MIIDITTIETDGRIRVRHLRTLVPRDFLSHHLDNGISTIFNLHIDLSAELIDLLDNF